MRLRSGELFAGVGGLGMAVDEVFGSKPGWFCEFDDAPSRVLAHHYPDIPNHGDVTRIDWATVPRAQILAGGFPCQDVSLAGRRRGLKEGTRSGLWSEFARAIDILRPDWVVIENVRGLLSADAAGDVEPCPWCLGDGTGEHALRALGAVLGDLAELGFDAEWTGIRASEIGAPHGRFRVFILAWPRERTVADDDGAGLEVVGRGGWFVERDSDGRAGEGQTTGSLKLFSTPDTVPEAPNTGSNSHKAGNIVGLGNQVMSLLPTPVAQPSGNSPEEHLRKKPGRTVITDRAIMAENDLIRSGGKLLPTPRTTDMNGPGVHGTGGADLRTTVAMMPTPRATRGGSSTEMSYAMGGSRSDDERPQGVVVPGTDWGPYDAAVRRWEYVQGRPAPSPVRFDGKGGNARLNPELTEWMMGWSAGWVTAPEIGLTRAEQLKACGNGVVPQQAAAALRELLARPGAPPIERRTA